MSKMTPTPWVAGGIFPYKGNEGYIFAISMQPEILVCKTFGSTDENTAPPHEQLKNSAAIVSAVNNTYGQNINPEAVKDLYDALRGMLEPFSHIGGVGGKAKSKAIEAARAAIEKAKL